MEKLIKRKALPEFLPNVYKALLRELDGKLIFCSKVFFGVVYLDTRNVRFWRRIDIQLRTNNGSDDRHYNGNEEPSVYVYSYGFNSFFLEKRKQILN